MAIRPAREDDIPAIRGLIRGLADYERMADQAVATEDDLRATLFGSRPYAEVVLAEADDVVAGFSRPEDVGAGFSRPGDVGAGFSRPIMGFALFFHNYSTFRGKPGIYLEDLFVIPEARGRGVGRALLLHVKAVAIARGCGRMEWSVLGWNEPAIGFYQKLGAVMMDDWRLCRITLP